MDKIEVTRPISNIESRTLQEVFDIMCARLATHTDTTPVAFISAERLNRKREFEANGAVVYDRPLGASTIPLYTHPPATDVAALVEPLESLIRFHESGGHAGDGSDENLTACKASIAALAPFTKGENDE